MIFKYCSCGFVSGAAFAGITASEQLHSAQSMLAQARSTSSLAERRLADAEVKNIEETAKKAEEQKSASKDDQDTKEQEDT